MNDPRALREIIGENVRRLRDAAGRTQDDVARAARTLGLAWPQTKIAALERGDKAVSLEEFFLLPALLESAIGREVPYGELLQAADGDTVHLSTKASAAPHDLAALFGARTLDPAVDVDIRVWKAVSDSLEALEARLRQLDLHLTARELLRAQEAAGVAEERAARKLGEIPAVFAAISLRLWGHGLTAERDKRVGDSLPPDAPAATVQAKRGRVTRELVDEVRDFITAQEGTPGAR